MMLNLLARNVSKVSLFRYVYEFSIFKMEKLLLTTRTIFLVFDLYQKIRNVLYLELKNPSFNLVARLDLLFLGY